MPRSTRTTAKRPSLKPGPCSSLNPKPAAPWCIPQGRPGICRRCRARPRVRCEHQRPLSAAGASQFLCTPASAGALPRGRRSAINSVESLRASHVLACGAARGLMPSVQSRGSLLSHAQSACYHTPRVPDVVHPVARLVSRHSRRVRYSRHSRRVMPSIQSRGSLPGKSAPRAAHHQGPRRRVPASAQRHGTLGVL